MCIGAASPELDGCPHRHSQSNDPALTGRQPIRTPTPQICPACGGGHALAECEACADRSLIGKETTLADLAIAEAFEMWFSARLKGDVEETSVRYISKSSESTYRDYAKALSHFFQSMPLRKIHDGHIRQYQDARAVAKNGLGNARLAATGSAKRSIS